MDVDIVLEKCVHPSTSPVDHMNEQYLRGTPSSMFQSIQNLFQRFIKSSSASSPSTSADQMNFRIRPFPMSSCVEESPQINPYNQRFYHVFRCGELERLIEEASKGVVGSRIVQSYYDHGNWCAIVQKDRGSSTL
jgi:hypothetical protein